MFFLCHKNSFFHLKLFFKPLLSLIIVPRKYKIPSSYVCIVVWACVRVFVCHFWLSLKHVDLWRLSRHRHAMSVMSGTKNSHVSESKTM